MTLAGRVATASGRGIKDVHVRLNDGSGVIRAATTNAFGYYRFDDIEAGQTVVVSISSKRYRFSNPVRVISLADNAFDVNFVSDN